MALRSLKEVYGCVCYVGQEPDGAGNRYGWSLAEQRPCECTEFRLGGVNMKPQMKPYEVKIGQDKRVSVNKQGHIIQSPDCKEHQSGIAVQGSSLYCAQNTLWCNGVMELQMPMTLPMRLEFNVGIGDNVYVYFSPIGPGIEEALYRVYLTTYHAHMIYIYKREFSQLWVVVKQNYGVSYIGVPVIITYDNGRFEVAVQGVPESTITYDVTYPPLQRRWFVSFKTSTVAELRFTKPCMDDFNPQQG